MTTLQNIVNLPNNRYKTKHGKFHLLIYTQRMHSISISTTEIPLLKGDRHSQSSVSSLFFTSVHSLSSLISRCDTFARYCTKKSLTVFTSWAYNQKETMRRYSVRKKKEVKKWHREKEKSKGNLQSWKKGALIFE